MAYKSLRMDKIKQVLDCHGQGMAKKKIARILGLSRNTVKKKKYINRYGGQGQEVTLDALQAEVRSISIIDQSREQALQDRLPDIIKELGRVGVTRYLLWQEYSSSTDDGFSYSRFCKKIAAYKAKQDVTIRMIHQAAEVLSIDFTGKKVAWIDAKTGEQHWAEVLVCTMPYSGYTFAYALPSQKQEHFIEGINAALHYMGGLPQIIQSDNLKSFVIKPDRYAPTFNELCVQLSAYYGVELRATRVGKPKDKASVERHVAIVYNKIYAPLRDQVFHSIDEINDAFEPYLEQLNNTQLQGKEYSRSDRFRDESPHLKPLPPSLFEITKSSQAKVQRNYHTWLGEDKHFYSVPYQYVGQTATICYTSQLVEVYVKQHRIAVHQRDRREYGYTSIAGHMPEKHQKYLESKGWDADYFKQSAFCIGPFTLWAVNEILSSKQFVEQSYNACLGILSLQRKYTSPRLENACLKAHQAHRVTLGMIKNILQNNMDNAPHAAADQSFKTQAHGNIRGENSYD